MSTSSDRVVVVGAGIVGLACARSLQRRGFAVTLIDRGEPGREASFGNAGGVAATEPLPMPSPGVLWRVPGWLLDPTGPLHLHWRYVPRLLPWLWRFVRASRHTTWERNARALKSLLDRVFEDLLPLLREAGVHNDLSLNGCLHLYRSASGLEADMRGWRLKERLGVRWERVEPDRIAQFEPDVAPVFACAVRTPDWGHVADPFRIASAVADLVRREGAQMVRDTVTGFEFSQPGSPAVRTASGASYPFRSVVVAAGPWSGRLARAIGDRALVESERGYHVTIPQPGVTLNGMLALAEDHFVMTPMAMGLRLAGTAEFGGLDAPPNYARAEVLVDKARGMLRRLDTGGATRWMGQRPENPDSLPVIGRSPRRSEVLYAFGHGHMGLTMSAPTGEIIARLAAGEAPGVDLAPFDIRRFA